MKYIGKVSSVLLTVAFVVAIVFANNNKNEIQGSKSSTVQQFQEKNQAGFITKKRESVEVVYDKSEELATQETNRPLETERPPQVGNKEIIPINDVVHSSKLNERNNANGVYTKSTVVGKLEESFTKQEIKKLVRKVASKGMTIVPLKLYFRNGWAKAEIGLARSKRSYQKKRAISERDRARELDRELKERKRN